MTTIFKKENPPFNFLGLEKEFSSYENSQIVILPVPYEGTVSYGAGTARGPRAIIAASRYVELFDEELKREFYTLGIHTLEQFKIATEDTNPEKVIKALEKKVAALIKDGKFVITLGGEHSISTGIVRAYLEKYPKLSVLQIDAHADLRDSYEGSPYSHACAMRRIIELCPTVGVGIRSLSREEEELIKAKKLKIYFARDIKRKKTNAWIKSVLKDLSRDVYLTFDLDGFDPALVPATGTPEPGGLFWDEVLDFLKEVTKAKNLVGFDIVELAPKKDLSSPDFLVAKLVYKIIGYKFAKTKKAQ